ncbi:MAG: acyl-CoA thioesterase [Gammaproteobacteria bacterium]
MNQAISLVDYVHCHHEVIRWGDMDAFGHVNNVEFFRYLESARVEYAMTVLANEVRAEGENIILADLRCAFRRQLKWPGAVDIYTRTARVGRTSMALEQAMCVADTSEVAATAETVLVWFDFHAQQPAPVPEAIRARIADYERAEPEGVHRAKG